MFDTYPGASVSVILHSTLKVRLFVTMIIIWQLQWGYDDSHLYSQGYMARTFLVKSEIQWKFGILLNEQKTEKKFHYIKNIDFA